MWRFACDVGARLAPSSQDAAEHEAILWLLPCQPNCLLAAQLAWQSPAKALSICGCLLWLTAHSQRQKKVVPDSSGAKHRLIHTTVSSKTSCWQRKPQTFEGSGARVCLCACVCVCSGMCECAYVGVWPTWWAKARLDKMWIRARWNKKRRNG